MIIAVNLLFCSMPLKHYTVFFRESAECTYYSYSSASLLHQNSSSASMEIVAMTKTANNISELSQQHCTEALVIARSSKFQDSSPALLYVAHTHAYLYVYMCICVYMCMCMRIDTHGSVVKLLLLCCIPLVMCLLYFLVSAWSGFHWSFCSNKVKWRSCCPSMLPH